MRLYLFLVKSQINKNYQKIHLVFSKTFPDLTKIHKKTTKINKRADPNKSFKVEVWSKLNKACMHAYSELQSSQLHVLISFCPSLIKTQSLKTMTCSSEKDRPKGYYLTSSIYSGSIFLNHFFSKKRVRQQNNRPLLMSTTERQGDGCLANENKLRFCDPLF